MFISVDPGKNVGVATFMEDGTDIGKKIMDIERFREFLAMSMAGKSSEEPFTFIVENFNLRHDKAIDQTGSDMPASKCIGAVEMVCTLLGPRSKLYWQNPSNLRGALKWAGYAHLANKPRNYHVPDDIAAYAHGVHRLIDLGIKKHPIFN